MTTPENKDMVNTIHNAIENGNLEVVKYLVSHGSDNRADDEYVRLASENGHLEVLGIYKMCDLPLYEHQRECVQRGKDLPRCLINMWCGCGKNTYYNV